MNTRLIIDKAGRVVVPKSVRKALDLEAGDALEMESAGEQMTLRPLRGNAPLTKKHGVCVFQVGETLPASATDEVLRRIREERDSFHRGRLKTSLVQRVPMLQALE